MKIYKYRDFADPDESSFVRLEKILQRRAFWCARPDTLNDPVEFTWKCDYSPSPDTAELLTELLVALKGRRRDQARTGVVRAINAGRLRSLTEPVIAEMVQKCRNDIGLVCFGISPDNETLWERYAADGAGICVELDVPDSILNERLRPVTYVDDKLIHVDVFLRSRLDPRYACTVYTVSLLSKPTFWAPEEEVRFVSKRQRVEVTMDDSVITRVILGPELAPAVAQRIRDIAGAVPVVPRPTGGPSPVASP